MKRLLTIWLVSLLPLVCSADSVEISTNQLKDLMEQGVLVVDVRTDKEWRETGVIEGSKLLTFFDEKHQSNPKVWQSNLEQTISPDQAVVVICRSGRRSKKVADYLSEAGYAKVYSVDGGIMDWIKNGNATVQPEN